MASMSSFDKKIFKTRVVNIGNIAIGGSNPIRIQSMTNTKTDDVEATVKQIIELADAGCEIARFTVQGKKEAYAAEKIKNSLVQKGYFIPLVADIHFYPPAAMIVADFVDKVRINPGNYAEKRAHFNSQEFSQKEYDDGLIKTEELFLPLIDKCKKNSIALRIGVNYGSLSDRIMNRYGNTIEGMVISAIEYSEICQKQDFHNIIFSMKASIPRVMIEAYRKLVDEMQKRSWNYPLHLGVTEAGEGEDGRIKSAVGMGSLLLDGIGDTIRVSLTEDPVKEILPAKELVLFAEKYKKALKPESYIFKQNKNAFIAINEISQKDIENIDIILNKENESDYILIKDEFSLVHTVRKFYKESLECSENKPILIDLRKSQLDLAKIAEIGSLFIDGIADGLLIEPLQKETVLNIFQAANKRFSKTEFISCPGCGRTLFDLQETAKRIKSKFSNYPGIKIAVMGCIVNGPGEMLDADFGYVGAGKDKIDLYVGKKCIEKNISTSLADDKLINLIKLHKKWIEPK